MDAFWDHQYEGQGRNSFFWARKADAYFIASETVKARWLRGVKRLAEDGENIVKSPQRRLRLSRALSLHDVYYYLLGGAIELLMKAILVGRDGNYFPESASKDSHRVTQIARKVGVALTEKEQRILAHLEENLFSFGRYPMPTRRDRWRRLPGVDGYWTEPGQITAKNVPQAIAVYAKIMAIYNTEANARRTAKNRAAAAN